MPHRLNWRPLWCRFYDRAHHVEHAGFVAVAYVDLFQLHHMLAFVSLWLGISGMVAFYQELRPMEDALA